MLSGKTQRNGIGATFWVSWLVIGHLAAMIEGRLRPGPIHFLWVLPLRCSSVLSGFALR